MCTAISVKGRHHLFGRTLDLERSYVESVTLTPRNFRFYMCHEGSVDNHSAILGVAHVEGGIPLYYDAINEKGLAMAALNFPGNAVYREARKGMHNVASFELIPWVLSKCADVSEARALLEKTNITNDSFSAELGTTPLHFIIADSKHSIVAEPRKEGLLIYDDPFGVLTNNPPFDYHLTNVSNYMQLGSFPPSNNLCDIELSHYSRGLGAIGLPGDFSSASRFIRAVFAKNHTSYEESEAGHICRFFHIMDTVSVPRGCVKTERGEDVMTVYTSCANVDTMTYYFTTYGCREIREIKIGELDMNGERLEVFPM